MKIGTWLLALVQPFIARILTALGFSLVTIAGMEVVIDQVKQAVFRAAPKDLPVDPYLLAIDRVTEYGNLRLTPEQLNAMLSGGTVPGMAAASADYNEQEDTAHE